jgi:hypothetical protein
MNRQIRFWSTAFLNCAPIALMLVASVWILKAESGQDTAAPAGNDRRRPRSASTTKLSNEQKIALAMKAAPADIGKNATVEDMTEMSAGKMRRLRAGANGWVCYASMDAPMCLDAPWQSWLEAWSNKKDLKVDRVGIAYMLNGDNGASNTDPYASAPTAENQWVVSPAHLMILFPDQKMLDTYPTDPKNGGPWVMWKGTPYAHLMVPVSPTAAAVTSAK